MAVRQLVCALTFVHTNILCKRDIVEEFPREAGKKGERREKGRERAGKVIEIEDKGVMCERCERSLIDRKRGEMPSGQQDFGK